MRKLLFASFITIISLFIATPVKAEEKNPLIYDITSFKVQNDQIIFEGWAYIKDLHNNYNPNSSDTKIEIIPGNIEDLAVEATYNNNWNQTLYQANCLRYKSGSRSCIESYEEATCNDKSGSSCRYNRAGFTIKFDIKTLKKEIGFGRTIDFKLRVKHEKYNVTRETSIAVTPQAATGITNNTPIDESTATITVGGISNNAKIITTKSYALADKEGNHLENSKLYLGRDNEHLIANITNTTREDFNKLKIYELYYNGKESCTYYAGKKCAKASTTTTSNKTWAYATWVQITGSVSIKLTNPNVCPAEYKNVPSLECENGIFEEIKNVELETILTIDKNDSRYNELRNKNLNKGSCSPNLTATITSDLTITQTAKVEFGLNPTSVDAGRGFYFDTKISGEASYQLCKDIKYEISELESVYECPDKSTMGKTISSGKESNYSWKKYSQFTNVTSNNNQCTYTGNIITKYEFLEDAYKKDKTNFDKNICKSQKVTCQQGKCSCEVIGESTSATDSKKQTCVERTGATYTCNKNNLNECPTSIKEAVEKKMNSYLKTTTNYTNQLGANVNTKDSNKATANTEPNTKMSGNWNGNYEKPTTWKIGEKVNYYITFDLKTACINTRTAEVIYIPGDNCDSLNYGGEFDKKYIDGGKLYYVPLKEPNGSYFPVQVKMADLSVVNIMKWPLNYECGVDCQQKLYEDPPGDMSYKFIYRPISLKNPFPRNVIGTNWVSFMQDKEAVESKMNRNNLEYSALLTPNDIARIIRYNKDKNYTNLDTINNNGTSSFIKEYLEQPMGSRFSSTTNYNKLGECTKDCWLTNNEEVG